MGRKAMKACILRHPAPIETNPLEYTDVPKPAPSGTQVSGSRERLRRLPD